MTSQLGRINDQSAREDKSITSVRYDNNGLFNILSNFYKVSDGKGNALFLGPGAIYYQTVQGIENILSPELRLKYANTIPIVKFTSRATLQVLSPGNGFIENQKFGVDLPVDDWRLEVNETGIYAKSINYADKMTKLYPTGPITAPAVSTTNFFNTFNSGSSLFIKDNVLYRAYVSAGSYTIDPIKNRNGEVIQTSSLQFTDTGMLAPAINNWRLYGIIKNGKYVLDMDASGNLFINDLQVYPYRDLKGLTNTPVVIGNYDLIKSNTVAYCNLAVNTSTNTVTLYDVPLATLPSTPFLSYDPTKATLNILSPTGSIQKSYSRNNLGRSGYIEIGSNALWSFIGNSSMAIPSEYTTPVTVSDGNGFLFKPLRSNNGQQYPSLEYDYYGNLCCFIDEYNPKWTLPAGQGGVAGTFSVGTFNAINYLGSSNVMGASLVAPYANSKFTLTTGGTLLCGGIAAYDSNPFKSSITSIPGNPLSYQNTLANYEVFGNSLKVSQNQVLFNNINILPTGVGLNKVPTDSNGNFTYSFPILQLSDTGSLLVRDPLNSMNEVYSFKYLPALPVGQYSLRATGGTISVVNATGASFQIYPNALGISYYSKLSAVYGNPNFGPTMLKGPKQGLISPNGRYTFRIDPADAGLKIFYDEVPVMTYATRGSSPLNPDNYTMYIDSNLGGVIYTYNDPANPYSSPILAANYIASAAYPMTLELTDKGRLVFNGTEYYPYNTRNTLTSSATGTYTNTNTLPSYNQLVGLDPAYTVLYTTANAVLLTATINGIRNTNTIVSYSGNNVPAIRLTNNGIVEILGLSSSYNVANTLAEGFGPTLSTSYTLTPSNGALWVSNSQYPDIQIKVWPKLNGVTTVPLKSSIQNTKFLTGLNVQYPYYALDRNNYLSCFTAPYTITNKFPAPKITPPTFDVAADGTMLFGGNPITYDGVNPYYIPYNVSATGYSVSVDTGANFVFNLRDTYDPQTSIQIHPFTSQYVRNSLNNIPTRSAIVCNNDVVVNGVYKLWVEKGKVNYYNGTTTINILEKYNIPAPNYTPILFLDYNSGTLDVIVPGTLSFGYPTTATYLKRFGILGGGPSTIIFGPTLQLNYYPYTFVTIV